jgi:colicin import membrane protein
VLEFVREHLVSLALATLMHGALIAVLVVGMEWKPSMPQPVVRPPVQALAVSEADLRAAEQRQAAARQAELRRQREEEARRQAEIRQQREREQAAERARVEAAERAEAERRAQEQRAADDRRRAEEARKAEEARRAEEARKAEEARRAEEARKVEEARRAEEARKAEEARRAEEARKAAEARVQAERQAQLSAQIEAEQRRMRLQESAEYGAWLGAIQAQVTRNWNRPPSARPGLECEVRVSLIPGMQVVSAEILRCNGDDAVRRSILAAVERASPLPRPSDPALFERTIVFVFRPED